MNKIVQTLADAVCDVRDGATVVVGGFLGSGTPHNLLSALAKHGANGLTVLSNGGSEWWPLMESGLIKRLISPFPIYRRRPESTRYVEQRIAHGELEIETVPSGLLVERIRAGGFGLGAFYRKAAPGTEFDLGKETREFNGERYVLEEAVRADVALALGYRADRWGNIECRLAAGNHNIMMAESATNVIVEVEEIVELGQLEPNRIDIPGIFVERVVKAPKIIKWAQDEPGLVAKRESAQRKQRGLTRELIALRAARELKDGMHVNLGIGLPVLTSNFIPEGIEVVLHSEQGVLGYGPEASDKPDWDYDLINASGRPMTLMPGASCFDFGTSFGMIRGGRLDMSILGAFEVSERGDLANWKRSGEMVGGVGGATELAMGAKRVIATMEHTDPEGNPRIRTRCSLPLTAPSCIDLIITNLAVIQITSKGLLLRELAPGITPDEVQSVTEPSLTLSPDLHEMEL